MKIEADTNTTSVTHYSTFDRAPPDTDDSDQRALDRLTASLACLDYLAALSNSHSQT